MIPFLSAALDLGRLPLFQLGRVVATRGALDLLQGTQTSYEVMLARHVTGDWGDCDPEDAKTNQEALKHGARVMSVYRLPLQECERPEQSAPDLADEVGERTIWVDCDVIQADGGTRTAAITGSFVALADAVAKVAGPNAKAAIRDCVAAVSVGIVHGAPALDLNYAEDSSAEVDMNVVMTGAGEFVEVQGTAEQAPFGRARLDALLGLAEQGIRQLVSLQRRALDARGERSFTL